MPPTDPAAVLARALGSHPQDPELRQARATAILAALQSDPERAEVAVALLDEEAFAAALNEAAIEFGSPLPVYTEGNEVARRTVSREIARWIVARLAALRSMSEAPGRAGDPVAS